MNFQAIKASIDTQLEAASKKLGPEAVRSAFAAATAPVTAASTSTGTDASLVSTLVHAIFAFYQLPPAWRLREVPEEVRTLADGPNWSSAVPLLANTLPWTSPQSLFKIVQLYRTPES